MNRARLSSLVTALVAVVGTAGACATSGAAPSATPSVGGLAPARVPPVPAEATEAVAHAWDSVRSQSPQSAALAVGGLGPADSASAQGHALVGFLALRRGDLAAARDAFGAALAAQPGMSEAAYGMGLVAGLQGDIDLARDWHLAALRADPGQTRAELELRRLGLDQLGPVLGRAESAAAAGDLDAAQAAYAEAIVMAPTLAGPYLSLAAVRRNAGDTEGAIDVLGRARRQLGDNPAVLLALGELFRDTGRYAEAADAFQRLADASPGDARAAALAREARVSFERAALPAEYRALEQKDVITREELAALLAIQLEGLEDSVREEVVIVGDVGSRWSAPFIRRMVGWGVLDVYQNNDFFPDMQVRRSMLVEAAYRVLELVGAAADAPRPQLDDPPPEHLLYQSVQAIVGLELMALDGSGSFDLLAPVSGREAVETVRRLATVVRRYGG